MACWFRVSPSPRVHYNTSQLNYGPTGSRAIPASRVEFSSCIAHISVSPWPHVDDPWLSWMGKWARLITRPSACNVGTHDLPPRECKTSAAHYLLETLILAVETVFSEQHEIDARGRCRFSDAANIYKVEPFISNHRIYAQHIWITTWSQQLGCCVAIL